MSPLSLLLNRRFVVGRRLCGCVGALAVCVLGQSAQAQQADSQPGRSPFLPQNWEQTQKTPTQPATSNAAENGYVFNGMIQIGSRTLFSIGNTGTGQAMLLEIGDDSSPVQVLAYDEQRNTISLGNSGRTEELTLRKSDGEPLAVASDGRGQRGGAPGQSASGNRSVDGQARSAQQIAWMEARRDRMNTLIERRRAEMSGEGGGGGAVTVGGGNTANTDSPRTDNNNAAGSQRSGDNAVRQGTQSEGGQSRQGVPRSRRLRSQMNP